MKKAVPALKRLNLSENYELSGPLPDAWGNASAGLQNLQLFSIRGCNLSGPLPASWAGLPALGYLDMAYNYFTGEELSHATCIACTLELCPAVLGRGSSLAMPALLGAPLAGGIMCCLKSGCSVTTHQ